MYLGLTEAYSVATVLRFMNHYLNMYPLTLSHGQSIYVCCNNQGVIVQITKNGNYIYPQDAISNNYPVYVEIQQQI